MDPQDLVDSGDRLCACRLLASAIGIGDYVRSQERAQALHVTVAGGGKKRGRDLEAAFLRHRETGALPPEMRPGTGGKLPARRRLAADRLRDFLETDVEHVVEQKGRTFQWRQARSSVIISGRVMSSRSSGVGVGSTTGSGSHGPT